MSATQYEEVGLSKARMLKDRILVEWEEATAEYGKTGLVRPEDYRLAHYTGIVVAMGPDVSLDLQEIVRENLGRGQQTRIAFDQWSRFDKFQDPERGRVAILAELAQADCLAIVPLRGDIQLNSIYPIGARVLIRPDVREWEEKAGLIVPGQKKVEVQRGEIIAAGLDAGVDPGDIVLYEKYAGVEFPVGGVEYILLESRKLVGIVEPRLERESLSA